MPVLPEQHPASLNDRAGPYRAPRAPGSTGTKVAA
jgi:hypothetical protein